jgi:radical SAM superfamily enzyme YgiQ (UPF0313 family)
MASSLNQVSGADLSRPVDAVFINAPLRDYDADRPKVNDVTLPVLGMAYIATYAKLAGFNVGVVDAEAQGLGVEATTRLVNELEPKWAGFNLLAPTYEVSANIAAGLEDGIDIMVGGHQAKAMPEAVIADPRFRNLAALVIGEGETRVAELLAGKSNRRKLPGVKWYDPLMGRVATGGRADSPTHYTAPDIDELPFVDRTFLVNDPYQANDGRHEANIVGARGCPYNCSFCGAARSANPDITIRTRRPDNIMAEMDALHGGHDVTAFRFVDDLFLGQRKFMERCMEAFRSERIGDKFVWDATGRINVLDLAGDALIDALAENGLREVALGIESGNSRMLEYIDKHTTPDKARNVVDRLTRRGISAKGYFILGFPGETRQEMQETVDHVHELWDIADRNEGNFRISAFEFRPYPGTPEWDRLIATGKYTDAQLLNYTAVDLTGGGNDNAMLGRDEFNFSVGIQFGEADVEEVRKAMASLNTKQYHRSREQKA